MSPKRKPKPEPDADAEFVGEWARAFIKGGPRGTLTFAAGYVGTNPSFFLKRTKAKRGFDAITMRTMLLLQETKAGDDEVLTDERKVGNFVVGWRADERLAWRYEE